MPLVKYKQIECLTNMTKSKLEAQYYLTVSLQKGCITDKTLINYIKIIQWKNGSHVLCGLHCMILQMCIFSYPTNTDITVELVLFGIFIQ